MKQFWKLFKKVGGVNVLRQYVKAHVLLFALFQVLSQGFSKTSLEIVRLSVDQKILCRLRKKYRSFICKTKKEYEENKLCKERSNKVWVCWLQGMERAPQIVQRCYQSLQENLTDREIVLLTEENYRAYVNFPEYIQEKIDNGVITCTHMSDLLRLELLLNYGGTWIDATVFCSGGEIPQYMMDSDLFLFQALKPGKDGHASVISSWFVTASTNHPILYLTRALLYEYWLHYNSMIDYFLLHDFFQLAIEMYPNEWNQVIPRDNATPHILLLRLFEKYDETVYSTIKEQTPFHKLTYKFLKEQIEAKDTYYSAIFGENVVSFQHSKKNIL